ncbi:ASCH domain-containing protein (plasmid) [Mesorhizobium sp. AR10]|uniref:ASCH domain-containing protein n=1 Tax=Mesorhizobium sp. AR10 TaxID=2865839 RepID=UPI00215EFBD5|nr:ASCH domain-containing protein [Mesorhizobium sp. AR10]UVK35801.1 ASCH domain-containing protein [Mesorhizobium sp. AR10]
MSDPNLALSIRQPWAELILQGRKTIEVRTWDTDYRGRFWLHTGKSADPDLDRRMGVSNPPRGFFVGRVMLESISPIDAARWELWRSKHLGSGRYEPGMLAWILSSPERLAEPVPAPGKLKLFEIDDAVVRQLRARLIVGRAT